MQPERDNVQRHHFFIFFYFFLTKLCVKFISLRAINRSLVQAHDALLDIPIPNTQLACVRFEVHITMYTHVLAEIRDYRYPGAR